MAQISALKKYKHVSPVAPKKIMFLHNYKDIVFP